MFENKGAVHADAGIDNEVQVFTGGANRLVSHPSQQVQMYHMMLKDFYAVFEEKEIFSLESCVYCHNYPKTDNTLFLPKFKSLMEKSPLFSKEDTIALGKYLKKRLGSGDGLEILNRFITSNIRPSKKLMDYTERIIKNEPVFFLIDDQLDAYNAILDRAIKATKLGKKSVILVKGGPGTGKSVIAMNVMAELLSKGKTVFHATGSAAFTTTLRKIVKARAATQFKYFNSFNPRDYSENEIDVLICDEAHRIRKTSNTMYTKKEKKSDLEQIDELMRAAKVLAFFIDDYQVVRPSEIGSSIMLAQAAKKYGAELFEFELKTQFRCSGSDSYLQWLDNALGIRETPTPILNHNEKMEFKIFDSPREMLNTIMKKNVEKKNSARMVAGFCWSWSEAKPDGTLVEDVVIGDFKMTWEAKNNSRFLAPNVPKAALWAYDENGVTQCGSIYTIQGFEFDYVGVIFGKDLIFSQKTKEWEGHPENSADKAVKRSKDDFIKLVKNAYRVLLSRGMRGVYVYFLDKGTRKYFESRIRTS